MRLINVPTFLTTGLVLQMPSVNAAVVAWILNTTGFAMSGFAASIGLPVAAMVVAGFAVAQLQRLPGGGWLPSLAVAGMLYPLLSPLAVLTAAFGARVFETFCPKALKTLASIAALTAVVAAPFVGVGAWFMSGVAIVSAQVLTRFGVVLTLEQMAASLGVVAFGPPLMQGVYKIARTLNLPVMLAVGALLHLQGITTLMADLAIQYTTQYIGMAGVGAALGGALAPAVIMMLAGWVMQKGLQTLYSEAHPYWSQTAQSVLTGALVGAGLSFSLTPLAALSYGLLAMTIQNSLSARISAGLGTVALLATVIVPAAGWTGRVVAAFSPAFSAGARILAGSNIVLSAEQTAVAAGAGALVTTAFNARGTQLEDSNDGNKPSNQQFRH